MVICPIARAVHCSGCLLVKLCPAKTILGDYGKVDSQPVPETGDAENKESKEESSDRS